MNEVPDKLNLDVPVPDLVRQSQAGSRRAFDCLIRRYQVYAMKIAVRILADAGEAAEAVQDGFVKAYLKIKKLKDPEKFGSWLLRIVVNCAVDRRASAIRRKRLLKKIRNHPPPAPHHDGETIHTRELQTAIQAAMGELTKTQARAIALFGIEDLSHKEVAEILGCSPQAARWHVYEARKKLKMLLKDYIQ